MPSTNLTGNFFHPNAKVVLFLNLQTIIDNARRNGWVDEPNFFYYFSDQGLDKFVNWLKTMPIQEAKSLLEVLANCQDQNRLYFAPNMGYEVSGRLSRTICEQTKEEHIEIFQAVLGNLRERGLNIGEWAPGDHHENAYWEWAVFRDLLANSHVGTNECCVGY